MNPALKAAFAILGPIIEKVLISEWESQGKPFLQGMVDKLDNEHQKFVAQKALEFIDVCIEKEIPEIF